MVIHGLAQRELALKLVATLMLFATIKQTATPVSLIINFHLLLKVVNTAAHIPCNTIQSLANGSNKLLQPSTDNKNGLKPSF